MVWSQVTVGNTVYATGSFSQTWPAGAANNSANYTPRSNLLAYDITTGQLVTSFNHSLNAQGLIVTASPDGSRVYVGGDFTTVDGQTRNHIAAFDTATGALDPNFKPSISSEVHAISVSTAGTVYVGGNFFSVNGVARTRLAAFTAANGGLLSWAPTADDNEVYAMVVTPDQTEVVIGGAFTTINGQNVYGLGAVTAGSGTSVPYAVNQHVQDYTPAGAQSGNGAAIMSLATDGKQIYGSGYSYNEGNFEGNFGVDPDTGQINYVNDCHGDTYSVFPVGQVLYTVSHQHTCQWIGDFPNTQPDWTYHHTLAFTTYPTGTNTGPDDYGWNYSGLPDTSLLHWYPTLAIGSITGQYQAAWSVTGNANYIAEGGEFPSVNGTAQVGLVRFAVTSIAPNRVGPQFSNSLTPQVVSLSSGTARVTWGATWDEDNQLLTYKVFRDDGSTPVYTTTAKSNFWQLPTIGFTDAGLAPGSTHKYIVRVYDPFNNTTNGYSTSVTISSNAMSQYAKDVLADSAADYWRLGETSGTTGYDWAGYSDLTEGTGVGHGASGAIIGDSDGASTFNGSSTGTASTTSPVLGPNTYTIGGWFKTTTTSGGKIVGFGSAVQGTSSGSYDRHIYMDNSGHLIYGVYNSGARTITTSQTYNDGQWHQVAASLSSTGMVLYVDGKKVGTNQTTTAGQSYSGYWRVGGDSLSGWPSQPTSNNFAGTIDDVAVYTTALSLAQVQQQYVDSGRTLNVPAPPTDTYGKTIYNSNPDLYWRLNEASGPTAADASINGDNGVYQGGITYQTPSTVAPGTAVTLNGSSGLIVASQQVNDPVIYSEEMWFNTETTSGGKLIGFGNASSGLSGSYDRHVYMLNTGQLEFGTWTGQANTIVSPKSYNDGQWHYLVATQGSDGMILYVDGQAVGTNPQTQAQNYSGYWRVGGDNTWGGASSNFFAGSVDEVAVYSSELTASQVLAHYRASSAAPNQPPVAAFTPTCNGLTCSVDGSASSDPDGSISSYAWTFGDDGTATGKTASHTYAQAGTYTITLTVTDNDGATNSTSKQVTVAPAPNKPPVAAFTPSCTALTCSVDGSASSDPDGTIGSYAWTFGDGATASGPTASHTYAAAGDFTITLTVTDNDGATNSTSQTVSPRPAANPPSTPYASDTFNRTVANGWGNADVGGAWSEWAGGSVLSVSPGVGSLTMSAAGATSAVYLGSVATTDTDTTATLTTDKPAAGGSGVYLVVSGRRVSKYIDYRVRVRLVPDGTVAIALLSENSGTETALTKETTLPGVSYSPGMRLNVRLQVTGTNPTTLRAKVWKSTDSQPTTWQLTATDATAALQATGSVGLLGYLSSAATNAPVTMQVSSFAAAPTVAPPTAAFTAACTGLSCNVDASTSSDPSGSISSYQWEWADGTLSTGVTSSHTYATAGTYRITLTVTDPSGWTDVTTGTVTVSP